MSSAAAVDDERPGVLDESTIDVTTMRNDKELADTQIEGVSKETRRFRRKRDVLREVGRKQCGCFKSRALLKAWAVRNFLPMGLATALIIGLSWPFPGARVNKPKLGKYGGAASTFMTIGIFIISGLSLKTDEIKKVIGKQGRAGFLYGLIAILGITPIVGFAAVQIPFSRPEFSYGLAIFCSVPTTLASGNSMVSQSGGNTALSLLFTVVTNLVAVVTTPFWLQGIFSTKQSQNSKAQVDAVQLLQLLLVTVLVPLVFGKLLRDFMPGMKAFITAQKVKLSVTNNLLLTLIVWQTLSSAAKDLKTQKFADILAVIVAAAFLHVLYLGLNWPVCSKILKLDQPEFKAVVIMSSQKTLPFCVTVIGYLGVLGKAGFMVIPCIAGHMSQLFIDAYLQSRWLSIMAKEEAARQALTTAPSVRSPSSTSSQSGDIDHTSPGMSATTAVVVGHSDGGDAQGGVHGVNGHEPVTAAVRQRKVSDVEVGADSSRDQQQHEQQQQEWRTVRSASIPADMQVTATTIQL